MQREGWAAQGKGGEREREGGPSERPYLDIFLSSSGKQGHGRQNPHGLVQNRSRVWKIVQVLTAWLPVAEIQFL